MARHAMQCWTFTGLVGAFLDLAIAFFLLCASTIAFFASKFLGVLGLSLPCPCDGQFVNPDTRYCLQRLLVDSPSGKASSVQVSVRSRFPFNSGLGKDQNFDLGMKLIEDRNNYGNRLVELEGEALCSSISGEKMSRDIVGRELIPRKFDTKAKGVINHRSKIGMRGRRKGGIDYGKFSPASSSDHLDVPRRPPKIYKEQNETVGDKPGPVVFGVEANNFFDDKETPTILIMGDRSLHDDDLNQPFDGNEPQENRSFNEELGSDVQGALVNGDEINTIRVLEQALEEEHNARAALYLELEEERNAAASAADEAMAMILRLQEEKASIQMQARQYQRIIEEKSAYDEQEMNILEEILLRREREKHFLEKEVEAYRQMVNPGNEQLDGDAFSDLMLHELSESVGKKEMEKTGDSTGGLTYFDMQKVSLVQMGLREWDKDADYSQQQDEGNQELQEKEMVTVDDSQRARPMEGQNSGTVLQMYMPSSYREHNLLEKIIPIVRDKQEKIGSANLCEGATEIVNNRKESGIYIQNDGQESERHGEDVYDVVIDDRSKSLPSDMPRSYMSELDSERLKIDNEVEWLRQKLRTVQEGREKLDLSVEHQEREKLQLQLQLLDDIACQLREIRQLTEPREAMRQVSLPPSSSKIISKKRRCQGASLKRIA